MGKDRSIHDSFGARVKFYRKQNNLSLYDLEKKTQISPAYLSRLERGDRKAPSYPIVEKIAQALCVPVYTLLDVDLEEEIEPKSLFELLILHDYTIFNRKAERYQKEMLISLLQSVLNCEEEPSDYRRGVEIVIKAQDFWNSLK